MHFYQCVHEHKHGCAAVQAIGIMSAGRIDETERSLGEHQTCSCQHSSEKTASVNGKWSSHTPSTITSIPLLPSLQVPLKTWLGEIKGKSGILSDSNKILSHLVIFLLVHSGMLWNCQQYQHSQIIDETHTVCAPENFENHQYFTYTNITYLQRKNSTRDISEKKQGIKGK